MTEQTRPRRRLKIDRSAKPGQDRDTVQCRGCLSFIRLSQSDIVGWADGDNKEPLIAICPVCGEIIDVTLARERNVE